MVVIYYQVETGFNRIYHLVISHMASWKIYYGVEMGNSSGSPGIFFQPCLIAGSGGYMVPYGYGP